MPVQTFKQLEKIFESVGVEKLYVKFLSRKQDNDKNQIYLGKTSAVTQLLPVQNTIYTTSASKAKRHSNSLEYKAFCSISFFWLTAEGHSYRAPDAKLIDYFQYPEVRFSGFLKGCTESPKSLRKNQQMAYGQRVLVLGSNSSRQIYGLVLTEKEDPLVSSFPSLNPVKEAPILFEHTIGLSIAEDPKDLLITDLRGISGIWHKNQTLKPNKTEPEPFKGEQGSGYTLEALLGIHRNSGAAPDKHGFEIKTFKHGGKVSLTTPTPDAGIQASLSFLEFMDRYSWAAKTKKGTRVFNGTHTFGKRCNSSGLTLGVQGYPIPEAGVSVMIQLKDDSGTVISGWSLEKLFEKWNKKHSSACYVEVEKRSIPDPKHNFEYKYPGTVYFGFGTTVYHFFDAVIDGQIKYDPGSETRESGYKNNRPQWRISVPKDFTSRLSSLYQNVEKMDVLD